jgi:serine/threonine protein kinase
MDPAKDPFDWVGKTIDDQFDVEELVGEGGFAVVYRGHHKGFDEKVAIKALKFPAKLGEEERAKFLETFKAEGKLLHKLSKADAAIVQALDVGAATSPNGTWTPYLVLEWLEGKTLEADLKERAKTGAAGRSLGDAIALLDPAAKGLATAHGMNVAHRDVKPANLFLRSGGDATKNEKRSLKIVDFGIAKVMSDSEDVIKAYEATGESIHAFSPRYGAPEQFARKYGATGPWTDVFALALVFIEVVAGKSAMKGDTSQLMATATDGVTRPTLRTLGVMESDEVEAVLTRALAVEPIERYKDAGAFWDALRDAIAKGDTVLSKRTGDGADDAAETVVEGQRDATPEEPAIPPTPAERATQLAVAALLFAVGAAALWVIFPHHGFSAPEEKPEEAPLNRMADLARVPDAAASAVDPEHVSMPSVSGYTRYSNDRYHFLIDIPNELTKFEGSATGDGRIYKNDAGDAVLTVYGADLTQPFAEIAAQETFADDRLQRWILPVHTSTPDMFVLMGFNDKRPFVEKGIANGGTYALLNFEFDPKDKDHFETLIPHLRDSFSFTAVSSSVAPTSHVFDAGADAAESDGSFRDAR